MFFDGYLLNTENIFEINDFICKYKDRIEEAIFNEKIKDISKILYSILLNIRRGMSIEDAYIKSDILSDNYKEHYKDMKLLSLIEYAVDNRHEDNDARIYLMPVNYESKNLLLCLFSLERNSVFEYDCENDLLLIKKEMEENLAEFYYYSYEEELPSNIDKDEWNYRKAVWSIAMENNDYIKHSFQYSFRKQYIDQLGNKDLMERVNMEMNQHGNSIYMLEDVFMGFDLKYGSDKKWNLKKLNEDKVNKKKRDSNFSEELFNIQIDENMVKWTYTEFYNYFKKI